jgi:hypothetical protein
LKFVDRNRNTRSRCSSLVMSDFRLLLEVAFFSRQNYVSCDSLSLSSSFTSDPQSWNHVCLTALSLNHYIWFGSNAMLPSRLSCSCMIGFKGICSHHRVIIMSWYQMHKMTTHYFYLDILLSSWSVDGTSANRKSESVHFPFVDTSQNVKCLTVSLPCRERITMSLSKSELDMVLSRRGHMPW